jgi:riboflavin synthase
MFTGLVQGTGKLRGRSRRGPGFRLEVVSSLAALELGESVAVDGVCLTVSALAEDGFAADVSVETAATTTLGELSLGSILNLERSLRVGDRMGGHLVSGHVDGVAIAEQVLPAGEALEVRLAFPAPLAPFIAEKGSVALDGVSLTVNAVRGTTFQVMLIPHTRAHTNFAALAPGRKLNLEVDLVARYVARALQAALPSGDESLIQALRRAGML